jgi:hypothetical protein
VTADGTHYDVDGECYLKLRALFDNESLDGGAIILAEKSNLYISVSILSPTSQK